MFQVTRIVLFGLGVMVLCAQCGSSGDPADALGSCDPLDDKCADGMYCQYRDGKTSCIAEGPVGRDNTCMPEMCSRGSICMPTGGLQDEVCQQPCDLKTKEPLPCDIGRHTCFAATGTNGQPLPFGVCRY